MIITFNNKAVLNRGFYLLTAAFDTVTPQQCQAWIKDAGYY